MNWWNLFMFLVKTRKSKNSLDFETEFNQLFRD